MPTNEVARVGAGRDGVNTLSAIRKIPIIFLPGTMGTRLADPVTGELVWNPTGVPFATFVGTNGPGKMAANVDRIADLSRFLTPDTTHKCILGNRSKARQWEREAAEAPIVNFSHVIPDFYADTLLGMHRNLKTRLKSQGMEPRIYCCGYDWRVDNALSAGLLAETVQRAQQECGEQKVIIVAHSMGGLVSRYYCKNLGGEANVAALFLLASPSLGAVDAYVTLRTGELVSKMLLVLGFVTDAIFNSHAKARAFIRKIPSVWQLLPSTGFSQASPAWATFDATNTGWSQVANSPDVPISALSFSNLNNMALFYLDMYTGFCDQPDAASRLQGEAMVAQALQFQGALSAGNGLADDPNLAAYMHPVTHAVYCEDNPGTPLAVNVEFKFRTVDPVSVPPDVAVVTSAVTSTEGAAGDKTVPSISAKPSKTTVSFAKPPFAVAGTEHQALPSDPKTIDYLVNNIASLLGAS